MFDESKTFIICELSQTHEGSLPLAKMLVKTAAEAGTPLGRFGNPLEFGTLVAFLVSDRSDYMTGTCIAIDGGALKTIT